jgi:hypothetical protein
MEGITLMPGIDDYPGKIEITSLADARHRESLKAVRADIG